MLSRHDPDVQDWDSLSADEKRLYARMMEVFAGFLTHTDHYIGELIDFLKEIGEYDNTLIMVISDNGASAEGGPSGSVNENAFFNNVPDSLEQNLAAIDNIGGPKYFNHYPWGWTFAGNTPFRRWKRETCRGGISDPFIVSWPKGMKAQIDVPPGHRYLSFEFEVTGQADVAQGKGTPGTGKLFIGDKQVGEIAFPVTTPLVFGLASALSIGADPGSPVTPDYKPPFKFTGNLRRVRVELSGEPFVDQAARFKMMLARQ